MYKLKLYSTMALTLALFIGLTTLAIIMIGEYLGFSLYFAISLAFIFNLLQWILAPKIIESIYKVKPIPEEEKPELHSIMDRISRRFNIKKPRLMIADIDAPNAFAYGSIFGEKKVAVTQGLLKTLDYDEVEAVLGHEVGHISHHDVSIMMGLSLLPTIFYLIWRYSLYGMLFGGYRGSDDRDSGAAIWLAIGLASFVFYIILNLILLGFSRLREYYADLAASTNIENGARKLMRALIKISRFSTKDSSKLKAYGGFKALLISDPDTKISGGEFYNVDELIDRISQRKLSFGERLMELFSTHPNIINRIKKLQELERNE